MSYFAKNSLNYPSLIFNKNIKCPITLLIQNTTCSKIRFYIPKCLITPLRDMFINFDE